MVTIDYEYEFNWENPVNKGELETAEKLFWDWWRLCAGQLDLNAADLRLLYGTALLNPLAHVFAARYAASVLRQGKCDFPFNGCWKAFERLQYVYPDYFRSYAYDHGYCNVSLKRLYLFGYFAPKS